MKKVSKILLFVAIFAVALFIGAVKSDAAEYIWPVGGNNAYETYKDYDFYGKAYAAPYKDGKSGREYIVNNELWPNEQKYYAACESHYGMISRVLMVIHTKLYQYVMERLLEQVERELMGLELTL